MAFKKFRYMVEALAEHLPGATQGRLAAMHHYQTMMGDIQDAEVLLAALDKFLRKQEIKPEAARRFRAGTVAPPPAVDPGLPESRRSTARILAAAQSRAGVLPDPQHRIEPATKAT